LSVKEPLVAVHDDAVGALIVTVADCAVLPPAPVQVSV